MDAKGKPPRLRPLRSLRDIFLNDAATPPCGGARMGVALPRLIAEIFCRRNKNTQLCCTKGSPGSAFFCAFCVRFPFRDRLRGIQRKKCGRSGYAIEVSV